MAMSPIRPDVLDTWAQRFEKVRESIETYNCSECIGHDSTRPGNSSDGRYALHCMGDEGRSELTRCSSLKRAEVVAESQISEGWKPIALYDLDVLDKLIGGDRLPVKHAVAGIRTIVIFDTVAS